MRLGVIAICVLFLTVVFAMDDYANRYERNQLTRLEVEKTKLEIEKLKYELAIYREQESLVVSVD